MCMICGDGVTQRTLLFTPSHKAATGRETASPATPRRRQSTRKAAKSSYVFPPGRGEQRRGSPVRVGNIRIGGLPGKSTRCITRARGEATSQLVCQPSASQSKKGVATPSRRSRCPAAGRCSSCGRPRRCPTRAARPEPGAWGCNSRAQTVVGILAAEWPGVGG